MEFAAVKYVDLKTPLSGAGNYTFTSTFTPTNIHKPFNNAIIKYRGFPLTKSGDISFGTPTTIA